MVGLSSDPSRKIIDAHVHLWNLDENYYPWLADGNRPTLVKNFDALRTNYLVADLRRDIGNLNVVAVVHIQAEHDHSDPVRETRWLQGIADDPESCRIPQAIIADADFGRGDVESVLERHSVFPNMRGIRHVLHRRLDFAVSYDPLEDPIWHRNFPLLRKYGLSFDMQVLPQQLRGAAKIIRANPDIQFVLVHAAMPLRRDVVGFDDWRRAVRQYATFPNVAIKISGFGTPFPDWSAHSVEPIVSEIMSAFTAKRVMLASNYPVERLAKSYADVWSDFAACFSSYSDCERDSLFYENAARIYRIDAKDFVHV